MKKIILLLITLLFACAPRGEYKSVDELLQKSKTRYVNSINADSLKELTVASKELEAFTANTQHTASAKKLADILTNLNQKAGYTTRPALNELILQYQKIAANQSSENFNQSAAKLLASRTYNLLASEMQSTAFRL